MRGGGGSLCVGCGQRRRGERWGYIITDEREVITSEEASADTDEGDMIEN